MHALFKVNTGCREQGVYGTGWKSARKRTAGRITTHYSQAELSSLLVAADKVCDAGKPESAESA